MPSNNGLFVFILSHSSNIANIHFILYYFVDDYYILSKFVEKIETNKI